MQIFHKIFTFLKVVLNLSQKVGQDIHGNQYFKDYYFFLIRKPYSKRWVVYAADADGSKIPPEWHVWMHYGTSHVPNSENSFRQPWQKNYTSNLSGAILAKVQESSKHNEKRIDLSYKSWTP